MATNVPTKFETTCTLKFYGGDVGAFPGSTAFTVFTPSLNSLRFSGGEETADFSNGQALQSLMRIIKQSSRVAGQLNIEAPSTFLEKYVEGGPLVEMTVTQANSTHTGTELTLVFKGLMKLPELDFLASPGVIDFNIEPYGVQPVITIVP